MGNGPTEDEAEIIQHDQLAQQSEDEPEVSLMSLRRQFIFVFEMISYRLFTMQKEQQFSSLLREQMAVK